MATHQRRTLTVQLREQILDWADRRAKPDAAVGATSGARRDALQRHRHLDLAGYPRDCLLPPERRRRNPPAPACRAPAPRQTRYRRSCRNSPPRRAWCGAARHGRWRGSCRNHRRRCPGTVPFSRLNMDSISGVGPAQLLVEDGLEAVEQVGLVPARRPAPRRSVPAAPPRPGWRRFPPRWRRPRICGLGQIGAPVKHSRVARRRPPEIQLHGISRLRLTANALVPNDPLTRQAFGRKNPSSQQMKACNTCRDRGSFLSVMLPGSNAMRLRKRHCCGWAWALLASAAGRCRLPVTRITFRCNIRARPSRCAMTITSRPMPMNYTDEVAQSLGSSDGHMDAFLDQCRRSTYAHLQRRRGRRAAMFKLQWRR